mmetsp:Transcript_3177/g.5445  ORF Transcript_3177/g.5445 Transcript_3177/m.5445 type:complete len:319 (-) Transcript_3177:275-1231(-)
MLAHAQAPPSHRRACSASGHHHSARVAQLSAVAGQNRSTGTQTAVFPANYDQAVRQAQQAVQAALADGHKLIEVEFPPTSLQSVQGDGEGVNEMNASMGFLRQWLGAFREQAGQLRIFWPDDKELAVALSGQTMDSSSGRPPLTPVFEGTPFKMGFLTKQNFIWALIGLNLGQTFSPVQQVEETDRLFVVAYPSFNPREEMGAVHTLYTDVATKQDVPIIIWNGELDRLRGGYYPAFAFRELAKLTKEFIPKFTQGYYIHNFKGRTPGVLFRSYPGPWCVYRRNPLDDKDLRLIWSSTEPHPMPSLKQVALEILPSTL